MELVSLWLPILVTSIAIFFTSSLAWMVLPHHRSDWKNLQDEEGFFKAIQTLGIEPGRYMFPYGATEEMKSEQFQKKWQEGPRGTLSLWSAAPNMGANLIWTFVFYLCVSICLAYLSTLSALQPGAEFGQVFRFLGTAGVVAYCAGGIQHVIWFKRRMITDLADGVVYGLVSGVVFASLWPVA